ncbi:ROK family transcriptional regulator [Alicyclobacillus cycloheptanicus]|uniref:Glucokinase-like ROK family protein n=1 Tax=Alicyclobacillus cycloheptanicus TaxID=1457 RepID=A0ABT9XGT1_9BACL|nr:ROK family transcriptional regulator [Alicyclobacillus cycloheptanicus]MDQ0189392.1 glucokinase-like ROK family protein [Alicyclobacillus cycloheptanicus]
MTRTGDQAYIKELNRTILLNALRFQGEMSRTQLAAMTGLNKATVSSLIDELIAGHLVVEVGHGTSQVGRRPILLMFNASAGFVIGIDLQVGFARIVATDLAGQIVQVMESSVSSFEPQHVIDTLVRKVRELATQLPSSPLGIVGVGVAVPALVDFTRGIVINAPNLNWKNIHLKALLEHHLSVPVYVDNEANAGALAEKLSGAGRDVSDLIYVSAGVGLGTGIIVNHELIRGADGMAGEFGHMIVEPQGWKCHCGSQGCWEMYASEKALVSVYQKLSGRSCTSEEILGLAKARDAFAFEAVQFVGKYLGIGISNIVNALNPTLIIIGNRLRDAGDGLMRQIHQTVQSRCFVAGYADVQIQFTSLGQDTCAVGAASVVLHDFFSGPRVHQSVDAAQLQS